MRKQHWLAPIWAAALLLTAFSTSYGQGPPGMMAAPVYGGQVPPPMLGPGGPGSVPIADPSVIPAGFGAWPNISPFENRFSQTINHEGLWYNDTRNGRREKYFRMDALVSWVRRPSRSVVGDERILHTVTNPTPQPVITVGGAFDDEVEGSELIDKDIVGGIINRGTSLGFKTALGYEDVDESGVELEGWYQSEMEWVWRRGQGAFVGADVRLARVTGAIPVDDGQGGAYIQYDQKFEIIQDSESGGANINIYLTPRYKSHSGTFRVRPMWGLRYLFVNEAFAFNGADSGWAYNIAFPPGQSIIDNNAIPVVDPYYGMVDTYVKSQMAGPHIGLDFEVGGDNLVISGAVKFGLLANYERVSLAGTGIGDPFSLLTYDQTRSFSEKQDHTHVSPMIEANINAEWYMFSHIPLLRKSKMLEDAKIRLGYNVLNVWRVARPNDIIAWRGQPHDSFIKMDYTKWYLHGLNIGLDWKF